MQDFKPIVGIDLGTTFSAIAYIDEHDEPVIIDNQEGLSTTPSIVHFYDTESYVVGNEAENMLKADPSNTVSFIKRSMGDSGFIKTIHGKSYTPQKISAFILKKLKNDAEMYFQQKGTNVEIKDAVITVPAYFGVEQKNATKEAGIIAGLNILRIIDEPTAAALSFGINNHRNDQTVFVFDLGGGTFDVTILEIKGNKLRRIATDGDPELGGKDWDDLLIEHCSNAFKEKHGTDPQVDPHSYQALYDAIVKAKKSLSQKPKTIVQVSHDGNREEIEITKEKFEELSIDLKGACEGLCKRVLKKGNKDWSNIDTVLLVGGSTYMPMIRSMIKNISDKEPSTEINPDKCVAIGAAFEARYSYVEKIMEDEKDNPDKKKELLGNLPDIEREETVAKSIGIIILNNNKEEVVKEMIPEQNTIPFTIEGKFAYAYDNQTSVEAIVTEGKGEKRGEVNEIGKIILKDLPPRREGDPIIVTYVYNKDKSIDIDVVDVETNKKQNGKVLLEGSMNTEEMEEAIKNTNNMKQI